jgi:hypothetical protein
MESVNRYATWSLRDCGPHPHPSPPLEGEGACVCVRSSPAPGSVRWKEAGACTRVRQTKAFPLLQGEGEGEDGVNGHDNSPHPHPGPFLEGEGACVCVRSSPAQGSVRWKEAGACTRAQQTKRFPLLQGEGEGEDGVNGHDNSPYFHPGLFLEGKAACALTTPKIGRRFGRGR